MEKIFYNIFSKEVKNPFGLYFFESAANAALFCFALVMMTIGLSMVRFAELPEREIEVPKETVYEKPKF